MNRFTSLLRKELTEFARTWKIWVIPGLFIVLAVTGVLSARFAKELMQSLLPAGSDMSTLIPDPTWRDTLGQWTKNLSQIGTIAILLMSGGIINTEGRQAHRSSSSPNLSPAGTMYWRSSSPPSSSAPRQ